jgi:Rrf2 family transcriptional regulator, nitric oxide-sensitive transcriptional repressor
MQLNRFTDLGLRVLIYLTQPARSTPFTISEMAEELMVSHNHLVKVVHFMGKQGWVQTTRGKGGGISLARPASEYRMGEAIKMLEKNTQNQLVDCHTTPCTLINICMLKPALDQALQVFFDYLDQYTLADMIKTPLHQAIKHDNRIPVLDLLLAQ